MAKPTDGGSSVRAYVLSRPGVEGLIVGGLTLRRRWELALRHGGADPVVVGLSELRAILAGVPSDTDESNTAPSSLILVDGGAAFEQATLDVLLAEQAVDGEAVAVARPDGALSPALRLGPAAARALAGEATDAPWGAPERLAQTLADSGALTLRQVEMPDPFWVRVKDAREAKAATWQMLKRLRLRPGGLAARAVNRHVSIRITRLIISLPISPNMITTVTGLLGLLAAFIMLQPGYLWGVLGAAVMQFSSIVDGTDGEVARLKYQFSDFGAWYDSVWDEIANAVFLAAVGFHLYATHGLWLWAALGLFAGVVSFVYASLHWHSKLKHGVGLYWWFDQKKLDAGKARTDIWEEETLMSYLKKLMWRDSFLLIYFFAALSYYGLPAVLTLSAIGAAATFGLLVYHIFVARARW